MFMTQLEALAARISARPQRAAAAAASAAWGVGTPAGTEAGEAPPPIHPPLPGRRARVSAGWGGPDSALLVPHGWGDGEGGAGAEGLPSPALPGPQPTVQHGQWGEGHRGSGGRSTRVSAGGGGRGGGAGPRGGLRSYWDSPVSLALHPWHPSWDAVLCRVVAEIIPQAMMAQASITGQSAPGGVALYQLDWMRITLQVCEAE